MNIESRARPKARAMGVIVVLVVAAFAVGVVIRQPAETAASREGDEDVMMNATQGPSQDPNLVTKEAIFAGGCFWCIEAAFELMPGVIEAVSGYTGGSVENPTYEQVSTGTTGHFEAVLVKYDPSLTSYEELLDLFWRNVNPTDEGGQFYDRGSQYFTAIFYQDEKQRESAEDSKRAVDASGIFDKPIVTQILPAQPFYVADDYHQDYYKTYLAQYKAYSNALGRKTYLEQTWDGEK